MTDLEFVIASEAKQSAVFLFTSTQDKRSKADCRAPYCDSKVPAIYVTGARNDGMFFCQYPLLGMRYRSCHPPGIDGVF